MPVHTADTDQRSLRILQEVLRAGEISVEALSEKFDVSPSTIRRALSQLEQKGLLRRTHGGAAASSPVTYDRLSNLSSFREQEERYASEKRRIGLAAAELIADGETVAIGAGTTTTQVARSIRHRKGITVVTNAINIAMELINRDDLKVIVTGGHLSAEWFALVGESAVETVSGLFVDKAFVGGDGINSAYGLTTNYPDHSVIHRALFRQAKVRVVVADHTKLGVTGRVQIWPTDGINYVVTDNGASDEAIAPFAKTEIKVIKNI
jgi:DeoR family transcriptional regulator of aga operon